MQEEEGTQASVEESPSSEEAVEETEEKENQGLSEYSKFYRKYLLIIEYKHLPAFSPSGVYVVPSYESLNGDYRRGIFKFILKIPDNYPDVPPTINFFTKLFHPQVHPETGALEIKHAFPSWTPHKNQIWHVLVYLKRIFYKPEVSHAANTEAAVLFTTQLSAFKEEAAKCAEESIKNVYINPENSSLCFSEWTPELDEARKILLKKTDGDDGVLSWVSKGVSKLINIQY